MAPRQNRPSLGPPTVWDFPRLNGSQRRWIEGLPDSGRAASLNLSLFLAGLVGPVSAGRTWCGHRQPSRCPRMPRIMIPRHF